MPFLFGMELDHGHSVALGFVTILALPSVWGVFRRQASTKLGQVAYQDEDGTAVKEPEAVCHYTTMSTLAINLGAAVGLTKRADCSAKDGWHCCSIFEC